MSSQWSKTLDMRTVRTVLHLCRVAQKEARLLDRPWQASLGAVSRAGHSEIASLRSRPTR